MAWREHANFMQKGPDTPPLQVSLVMEKVKIELMASKQLGHIQESFVFVYLFNTDIQKH